VRARQDRGQARVVAPPSAQLQQVQP
jgi:hypothetical protein